MADSVDEPNPDAPRTVRGRQGGPVGRDAPRFRRLTIAAVVMLGVAGALVATVILGREPATVTDLAGAEAPGPSSATLPSATPSAPDGPPVVDEGPGFGSLPFAGAEEVQATVFLPDGWETWEVFVLKSDTDPATGLAFFDVANIYSDPCRWELVDPPPGPAVDDLVAAFEQSTVFEATQATDVTVDGFRGKYFQVTVPEYDEEALCTFGLFKQAGARSAAPELWAQAPGETLELWVLDVDGTRLVVSAGHYPDTPDEDREDMAEMVATLDIVSAPTTSTETPSAPAP